MTSPQKPLDLLIDDVIELEVDNWVSQKQREEQIEMFEEEL